MVPFASIQERNSKKFQELKKFLICVLTNNIIRAIVCTWNNTIAHIILHDDSISGC